MTRNVEPETPLFTNDQRADLQSVMAWPKGSVLEPTYVPETAASSSQGPMFTNSSFALPLGTRFGNASAADADLDLLVALIMAIQKGWGDSSMKNFVYLYAIDFLDQVVKSYDIKNNFMNFENSNDIVMKIENLPLVK
jgi:hypothetical protein